MPSRRRSRREPLDRVPAKRARLAKDVEPERRRVSVLLLGLDGAGKTTLLESMCAGRQVTTTPTRDFNIRALRLEAFDYDVWDLSGAESFRANWRHYAIGSDVLVWVADVSSSRERLDESLEALRALLCEPAFANMPIAIIANTCEETTSASVLMPFIETSVGEDANRRSYRATIVNALREQGRADFVNVLRWASVVSGPAFRQR